MYLNQLSQLHVLDHFHTQRARCPDLLIDASPNQVEWTEAQVVLRMWIINLPGPVAEDEQKRERSHHHALAGCSQNVRRKYDQVVCLRCFRVCNGTAQSVCAEAHISVGKQQPIACGLLPCRPHGVRLSKPTRRQFVDVQDAQRWSTC